MYKWIWTIAALLCAALAACGGGGGGASTEAAGGTAASPGGTGEAPAGTASAPQAETNRLFVYELNQGTIAMLPQVDLRAASSVTIRGTLSTSPLNAAIAYDSGRDVLYATADGTLRLYTQASTLASGAAPTRTVQLTTERVAHASLQLDRSKDVLYVALVGGYGDATLLVFTDASQMTGATAPTRTVRLMGNASAIAIDVQRGQLYATGSTLGVVVYTGFETATGPLVPSRFLLSTGRGGIALDATRDRLYATNWGTGGVLVLDGASGATRDSVAALVQLPYAEALAYDPATDRLYVGAYEKAYLLENASGLGSRSTAPAAATVAPAGSYIAGFAF